MRIKRHTYHPDPPVLLASLNGISDRAELINRLSAFALKDFDENQVSIIMSSYERI